jgi:hypothetical protein
MITNIYTPSIGAPNFIEKTLLEVKAELGPNTVIVRDFSALESPVDRPHR